MSAATLPTTILAALTRGSTVLTANQRAARTLRQAFDRHMRSQAAVTWTPPDIVALDTWLPGLWSQLLLDGVETAMLLNRTQEHALWRAIIAADREVTGLRSADSLAEMAARAWHLLCLHNGRAHLPDFAVSTDARAFQRWAHRFERTCARSLYLSHAQLPAALERALSQGTLPIPNAGLMLVDFGQIPPAHRQFFDSIQHAGYAVEELTTSVPTDSASLYTATDNASELRAAATWARRQLDQNPEARIAIVVPSLAQRRAAIERAFASCAAPELQPITASSNPPFEFSLGRPLSETALAATALDLLRWSLEALPLERIGTLLLSPFFGAASSAEALAAAEFDAFDLRTGKLLRPELTLDATLDRVRTPRHLSQLGSLPARLRQMHQVAATEQLASPSALQGYAAWTDAFRNILEAAGWSLASQSNSLAFQARRRWESALDEVATLDFNGSQVTAATALQAITRIVRQTIFAPESREAPIQILGPLELGGVPFDALWFLAADDSSWPAPAASYPLIPWHIQRDLAIPGASPQRDTAAAQVLTNRIANSATNVVFSFAAHAEDRDRQPSSLLRSLNLIALPPDEPSLPRRPLIFETFTDNEPLPSLPDAVISGGAQVLELQAACAFRAFAERRLFSTEPDTREPGLDPRERGSLVHDIMQAFWTRIESQAALRALSQPDREAFLDDCIDLALEALATRILSPWDDAYLEVQRQRLRSLLRPWLQIELDRPRFVVQQRESESQNAHIGPLKLNLRVDRVDETAAGALIIDYKTGEATPSQWLGDRPDAPQLPLYAVLSENPKLGGVAFANLRAGDDLCLKGFADNIAVLAKPTRNSLSLPDQLEDWYRVLTNLATAFAEGDARVAPKCYPKTCQYCSQRILCRLDPSALEDFADEDNYPAELETARG